MPDEQLIPKSSDGPVLIDFLYEKFNTSPDDALKDMNRHRVSEFLSGTLLMLMFCTDQAFSTSRNLAWLYALLVAIIGAILSGAAIISDAETTDTMLAIHIIFLIFNFVAVNILLRRRVELRGELIESVTYRVKSALILSILNNKLKEMGGYPKFEERAEFKDFFMNINIFWTGVNKSFRDVKKNAILYVVVVSAVMLLASSLVYLSFNGNLVSSADKWQIQAKSYIALIQYVICSLIIIPIGFNLYNHFVVLKSHRHIVALRATKPHAK